jgi:hypothetical protein
MTIPAAGASNPNSCILDVIGGLHSGASVALGANGCSIGTEADCDVILTDAGIAGHHLKLLPHGQGLRVETGDDFALVGKTKVPAGHGLNVKFPAEFRIGEASFRVSRPLGVKTAGFWSSHVKWIACGVATVVVAAATVQAVAGAGGMAIARPSPMPSAEVSLDKKPPVVTATDAAGALSGQLSKVGLDALQVQADGTRLLVSGYVSGDGLSKWQAAQEWFDANYAGRFVLSNAVSVKAPSTPDVRLQAVWLGEKPYAVIAGGRRIYTGETVGDGWVMTAIGNDRVEFRRSAESFSLTF